MRPSLASLAMFAALGCAPRAALTPSERGAVLQDARTEGVRWLQVSARPYRLAEGNWPPALAPLPPPEWEIGGHPPPAGQVLDGIVPAGTPASIVRIDFPVGPFGQKSQHRDTYVTVQLGNGRQAVLVVDGALGSEGAFWDEVELWLTPLSPASAEEGWNEAVRAAVKEKRTLSEMPAEAVVAAWGYPRTRVVLFSANGRRESWTWPGGMRSAEFQDGHLVDSKAPDASGTVP
ncbi:MAG: hypothetical protein ACLPJH_10400 [Myxococcaceae bacterium]